MTLLPKIKKHGYWEIVIRPTRFDAKRVANIHQLREIARTQRVEFRGWDFPHYGREPSIAGDHIEQEDDYLRHVEAWRLYQSGMFVYLGALRADWEEQDAPPSGMKWVTRPRTVFEVADTVWVLTEAFEFASRLALSEAGSDRIHVSATVYGLQGRRLWMDLPGRDLSPRPPLQGLDEFPQSQEFARDQLVVEAKVLALKWAREVFRRFGWDASLDILGEVQAHRF